MIILNNHFDAQEKALIVFFFKKNGLEFARAKKVYPKPPRPLLCVTNEAIGAIEKYISHSKFNHPYNRMIRTYKILLKLYDLLIKDQQCKH